MSRNLSTLLFLAVLCFACEGPRVKKELIGSWRYDLDSMKRENLRTQKDPSQRSYMETMLLGLEMAKIELFDDGSAVFRLDDTLEKGNWRVQNNGKELVVKLKGGDQVSRIQRIAQDTIFLDPVSAQGPQFTRVLVPAQ